MLKIWFILVLVFGTAFLQDSWESYETSSMSEEDFDDFDIDEAKEYFCSYLSGMFYDCTTKWSYLNMSYFLPCAAEAGLRSTSVKEALEDACNPNTSTSVGRKLANCRVRVSAEFLKKNSTVLHRTVLTPNEIEEFDKYCFAFVERLKDEGWLKYFLGPSLD
ncbi:uncharacterized protein LOC118192055 [Stegodyphus dumicola]|uniref:uncharacterized protein LOC118192055 n=1 Tax=Stegodyphus dumicola TaxID=202533 RepID=UPI0015B1B60E|nr:uncharacterized protein LOC118192055 [Stegodyphus dumicola]